MFWGLCAVCKRREAQTANSGGLAYWPVGFVWTPTARFGPCETTAVV